MDRALLLKQLQEACDLEEKFISNFDAFLKEHVSDNPHFTDDQRDFVEERIVRLVVDSKRHLEAFQSMIEKINKDKYLVL